MARITPNAKYHGLPCSYVAVGCAAEEQRKQIEGLAEGLKSNGYLSLNDMNKYIRTILPIKKKEYFKRGERPKLLDILKTDDKKAVVCLLGHYVYIDGKGNYWSFFKNEYDDVVCIWWIKEE